jgi:BirA family biotin operon repressor/biotin-[acetyl-CoA-carboxylase] ligase
MRSWIDRNPFGAPVYHRETVSSTMDEARLLAAEGAPHGTVIAADFQEKGRGRTPGRPWEGARGENLFFTILLRYPGGVAPAGRAAPPGAGTIPPALTLRTGLAVSRAVEDFDPLLAGRIRVKWPNDIMALMPGEGAAARKVAGILTESDGNCVYTGVGVNLAQTGFPPELRNKAGSLFLARRAWEDAAPVNAGEGFPAEGGAQKLLDRILARLYDELEGKRAEQERWREKLEERLYLNGARVRFLSGAADRGAALNGILAGVGSGGELLLVPEGESGPRAFVTGELDVYDT